MCTLYAVRIRTRRAGYVVCSQANVTRYTYSTDDSRQSTYVYMEMCTQQPSSTGRNNKIYFLQWTQLELNWHFNWNFYFHCINLFGFRRSDVCLYICHGGTVPHGLSFWRSIYNLHMCMRYTRASALLSIPTNLTFFLFFSSSSSAFSYFCCCCADVSISFSDLGVCHRVSSESKYLFLLY